MCVCVSLLLDLSITYCILHFSRIHHGHSATGRGEHYDTARHATDVSRAVSLALDTLVKAISGMCIPRSTKEVGRELKSDGLGFKILRQL